MFNDKEKLSTGIRNDENESGIYPTGNVEPIHKTKEDIRPLPEEAKTEQEKKSDTHYSGESSKGVKKTDMANVSDDQDPNEEDKTQQQSDADKELIEKTTWEIPQPDQDKEEYHL